MLREVCTRAQVNKLLWQGYVKERLKSSLRKFYGWYGDLTKQYEVPLSRMLHDILDDDNIQWHPTLIGHCTNFWPLLIWTLLPNLTFYLIVQGFHRTYATGAACQQRTLTPPDTWSCPTLGLACVLMSRPISPELVLSPDFWIPNIPRYFSFASKAEGFPSNNWGRGSGPCCLWRGSDKARYIVQTALLVRVQRFRDDLYKSVKGRSKDL